MKPIVVLLLALAVRAVALEERPAALQGVAYEQRLGQRVPLDAEFRDESGAVVRLGDYFTDKPVVLVPAYYRCPMLCGIVLKGVVSTFRGLGLEVGKDFRVVTFSFDAHETPPLAAAKQESLLAEYGRPAAAADWHFLTGDEPAIHALTEAIGFHYAWDEATQQFAHASGIVVLTPDGTIARYFFGVEFPPKDVRLALVEASDHRIGSVVDALLLFCFHYDSATGRYGRVAFDAVRVGGLLTLFALATFVGVMLRRDARGTR